VTVGKRMGRSDTFGMTESTGKAAAKGNREGEGSLILAGFVLAVLVLIPTLIGYGLFRLGRRWLARRENIALLLVSLAAVAFNASYCFTSYGHWLGQLARRNFSLLAVPWLPLLLLSLIVTAVCGLLSGSSALGKFSRVLSPRGTVVRTRKGRFGKGGQSSGGSSDILPDLDVRTEAHRRGQIAKVPGSPLSIDASSHSIMGQSEPGKRKFPIGRALDQSPVYLSEDEIRMHGLILGSTGSGKTEAIKALAGQLLDLGWSGTLVDLKEDTAKGGLRDWCFQYATHHSTPFQELCLSNPHSPTWFNALAGMGPDEMRDTILSLNEFEAAYYEALNKELLGQIIMLMTWAHEVDPVQFPTPTMYDIAKLCSNPSLPTATKKMRAVVQSAIPGLSDEDFRALVTPTKAQQESATGFGSRLGNLYDSQAGRAILRPGADRIPLDVTLPGLTYVGLDSQGKPDLTRVISSALLQRMSVYAAQRTTGLVEKGQPRFLIVDEANWVNREISQNLLSRARGAGISMWLCTQGPQDWIDKNGDDWAKLTQNINVAVIMRQNNAESAEMCADLIGKSFQEKISESVQQARGLITGPRRMRDADGRLIESFKVDRDWEYIVAPDNIRNLTIGESLIRVGTPQQRLDYARIEMRDPTSSPARVPFQR